MAWPIPTARAPTGRRRKRAPSVSMPDCATTGCGAAIATAAASAAILKRRRLINEHDGNVIADRVPEPARVADELCLRLAVLELTTALRADEDRQQLGRYAHRFSSGTL